MNARNFLKILALTAVVCLFAQPDLHAMGGRVPMEPEPLFKNDPFAPAQVMKRLPMIQADPDCRAPTLEELYPDFRGDYATVKRSRVWPPTVLELWGQPRRTTADGTQGALPDDHVCRKEKGERCWAKAYSREFAASGVNLEPGAYRGYCHRQNPQKLDDVFALDADFPADFISLFTPEYIEYRWENVSTAPHLQGRMSKLRPSDLSYERILEIPKLKGVRFLQAVYPEHDIVSLYELNIEAARLWKKLADCYNGSAVHARRAYFEARFDCSGANPDFRLDGAELRRLVGEFLGNVRNFYQSSFFKRPEVNGTFDFEVMRKLERREQVLTIDLKEVPSVHPLFAQATYQIQTEISPLDRNIDMREYAEELKANRRGFDERIGVGANYLQHIAPAGQAHHFGLWPSAMRATRGQIEYRTYQMLAAVQRGAEAHWYGVLMTGIDDQVLPSFYPDNAKAIALEVRKINARYKAAEPRAVPVKAAGTKAAASVANSGWTTDFDKCVRAGYWQTNRNGNCKTEAWGGCGRSEASECKPR